MQAEQVRLGFTDGGSRLILLLTMFAAVVGERITADPRHLLQQNILSSSTTFRQEIVGDHMIQSFGQSPEVCIGTLTQKHSLLKAMDSGAAYGGITETCFLVSLAVVSTIVTLTMSMKCRVRMSRSVHEDVQPIHACSRTNACSAALN
jgi:hypothetical protein